MATHFTYYDDWRSAALECPRCGWRGTFDDGLVEVHDSLMDSSCPRCRWPEAPMLAIVSYPTIEEGERNRSRLNAAECRQLAEWKRARTRWNRVRLKSPDQLPALEGTLLTLEWDIVGDDSDRMTVLRCGDTVVWREPAIWEGYERFVEVVLILQQRYGRRLTDVVPSAASELYLYGDKLGAPDSVRAIRRSLETTPRERGAVASSGRRSGRQAAVGAAKRSVAEKEAALTRKRRAAARKAAATRKRNAPKREAAVTRAPRTAAKNAPATLVANSASSVPSAAIARSMPSVEGAITRKIRGEREIPD